MKTVAVTFTVTLQNVHEGTGHTLHGSQEKMADWLTAFIATLALGRAVPSPSAGIIFTSYCESLFASEVCV